MPNPETPTPDYLFRELKRDQKFAKKLKGYAELMAEAAPTVPTNTRTTHGEIKFLEKTKIKKWEFENPLCKVEKTLTDEGLYISEAGISIIQYPTAETIPGRLMHTSVLTLQYKRTEKNTKNPFKKAYTEDYTLSVGQQGKEAVFVGSYNGSGKLKTVTIFPELLSLTGKKYPFALKVRKQRYSFNLPGSDLIRRNVPRDWNDLALELSGDSHAQYILLQPKSSSIPDLEVHTPLILSHEMRMLIKEHGLNAEKILNTLNVFVVSEAKKVFLNTRPTA